jgi:transposase-like protein
VGRGPGQAGWALGGRAFWTGFLRALARRGLRGVKLVVSDADEGIKAAVSKVMSCTRQRCRVHFTCNVMAHAGKSGRRVGSAFMSAAFAQDDADAAKAQRRQSLRRRRPGRRPAAAKLPRLAGLLDRRRPMSWPT